MGKIVLLDDSTINKIAAGEVIERPASVVKEMVENSVDAGSTEITVEIKNGGISLIKVIDNGSGISEDDMELAFERHATSKIRSADDLEEVETFGFRGEALASVAAIANVEMISKREDDDVAHKLVIKGGKVLETGEDSRARGTTIIVKNLFYNTPVRYKFLKKDFTEAGYIEDAITRIALIHPEISFKLINSGKTVIQTNGNGKIKDVIYTIFGRDVADGIVEVENEYEGIKVSGIVGNKYISRSNRNGQFFFVNGRFIKDKTCSSAVDQAYKDILPSGKYAFCILNIEMDLKKVDVNVHPAKLEVRFEEEQNVFKAINYAAKNGIEKLGILAEKMAPKMESVQSAAINGFSDRDSDEEKEEKIFDDEDDKENDELEEDDNEEKEDRYKHRAGTFSGFFKKILDKDETEEEKNNTSMLEDILKHRQTGEVEDIRKHLNDEDEKENDIKNEIEKDNKNEEEKEIEESRVDAVKIGNTLISSDTQPSDYNLNDLIKESKTSSETIKIDTSNVIARISNNSKTEVFDSIKKIDEDNSKETRVIDFNVDNIEEKEEPEVKKPDSHIIDSSESVTEKIMKQKIELDIDDTQFIDTNKVRENLNNDVREAKITPEFANMYKKVFGSETYSVRKEKEEEEAKLDVSSNIQYISEEDQDSIFEEAAVNPENSEEESNKANTPKIRYRFVGVIFGSYAVIEVKDEMYMIENKAAEERLMYERVSKEFEEGIQSTELLLSDIITLDSKLMSIANQNKEIFEKGGFKFEEFGDTTLKLSHVPTWAEKVNTKKLFIDILNDMDTIAVTTENETKEEKFVSSISNHYIEQTTGAVTDAELEELIKKLLCLDSPFMYPTGRLVAVKITKTNMEKKFSRRN